MDYNGNPIMTYKKFYLIFNNAMYYQIITIIYSVSFFSITVRPSRKSDSRAPFA